MADFPTSPHTFTPFANGALSDAAQVTDIYNEVEAMQVGYLNGAARLNSSNSTLANLSVPGKSTVAQLTAGASTLASISVTGNSTFDANVTIAGSLTVTGTLTAPSITQTAYVLATGSTSQFANGSSGSVSWPTNTATGNSSIHSTGTNPDRFLPQSSGVYVLSAAVTLAAGFADPSTGVVDLWVKDSSGGIAGFVRTNGSAGGRAPTAMVSGAKYFDTLAAAPYLRVALLQRGGSTASIDGSVSHVRFNRL